MAQKALLVGINDYPSPRNKLSGCINDINDVAAFLTKKVDFSPNDIRMITDERATADEIKKRLYWLVEDLKPGDKILYQYSGHGAVFPVRNDKGKVDNIYECICPYDFKWTVDTCVRDVDFEEIFSNIPEGVQFVWISDSCHSGGLINQRSFEGRDEEIASKPRQFYTPDDIAWRIVVAEAEKIVSESFRAIAQKLNASFIAACRADQTASDAFFGTRPNGALTYCLLQTLNKNGMIDQPLSFVMGNVINDIRKHGFKQEPQLEGETERKFLKE
ncbi:MAG TPA: caspase family protein [Methanofastidiosum sp.]|nr:caspase family protein [Methanofastidiosum sp.]